MGPKKNYSQASRVQGILRTLGVRHTITIGELAEEFGVTRRTFFRASSLILCLIGNGTAWRDWVDWELRTAISLGKGVCGVRLKQSYGRTPQILKEIGAPIAPWDVNEIIATIECAAARRSQRNKPWNARIIL